MEWPHVMIKEDTEKSLCWGAQNGNNGMELSLENELLKILEILLGCFVVFS